MVMRFQTKLNKCPKMGSLWQIFTSSIDKITIFSHLKHIILLKLIARNGVITIFSHLKHTILRKLITRNGVISYIDIAPSEL